VATPITPTRGERADQPAHDDAASLRYGRLSNIPVVSCVRVARVAAVRRKRIARPRAASRPPPAPGARSPNGRCGIRERPGCHPHCGGRLVLTITYWDLGVTGAPPMPDVLRQAEYVAAGLLAQHVRREGELAAGPSPAAGRRRWRSPNEHRVEGGAASYRACPQRCGGGAESPAASASREGEESECCVGFPILKDGPVRTTLTRDMCFST